MGPLWCTSHPISGCSLCYLSVFVCCSSALCPLDFDQPIWLDHCWTSAWLFLLALALDMKWVHPPPPPDPKPYQHCLAPLICNMHYHKSYPFCLRTPGHYVGKAPSIDIQAAQHHLNAVQGAASRLKQMLLHLATASGFIHWKP